MQSNLAPTLHDDPALRETLKRCTPATYYAACKFRATGDTDALRTVIGGVVDRFVDRELRAKLGGPLELQPALRLREDLGLDSLTMMEVVMLAEEVLPITIANEELVRLQTLGQVHEFFAVKLAEARRKSTVDGASPVNPLEREANVAPAATAVAPREITRQYEPEAAARRAAEHGGTPDTWLVANS